MNRLLFLAFAVISLAFAQIQPRMVVEVPENQLEAAHQANPDDLNITTRLLRYYATANRDTTWSARYSLLSWNIEHHPEAPFLSWREAYSDIPDGLHTQLKQLWIAQVHQHPDDPQILRNAAMAMEKAAPPSIRVGGNVQASKLISQVQPAYPELAKQARIQGTVRFNATISPQGDILNLQLVSGHPLLVASATSAVTQWRYKPTLLNGNPVTVVTTIDVNFTLNDTPSAPPAAEQLNPFRGVKLQ